MKESTSKQRGDVAEYRVLAELLRRQFNVLVPVGDRLPYDLAIDHSGSLVRVQVKRAWYEHKSRDWIVSVKRSQTNRRTYRFTRYQESDFDVLIAWIPDNDVFYVFPASFACKYAGSISMVEGEHRQRVVKTAQYREAWYVLPEPVTESIEQNGRIEFGADHILQQPLV